MDTRGFSICISIGPWGGIGFPEHSLKTGFHLVLGWVTIIVLTRVHLDRAVRMMLEDREPGCTKPAFYKEGGPGYTDA